MNSDQTLRSSKIENAFGDCWRGETGFAHRVVGDGFEFGAGGKDVDGFVFGGGVDFAVGGD